jgi:hypothetical protein
MMESHELLTESKYGSSEWGRHMSGFNDIENLLPWNAHLAEGPIAFFFFLAQIEWNLITRKETVQPSRKTQKWPRGNQEMMFIWGQIFQVTSKVEGAKTNTPPKTNIC